MVDKLPLTRGRDWRHTWPLSVDGDPWVWQAGDTVRGQVRADTVSGPILHEWTRGDPEVFTADGSLTLIIPATVSETWTTARAIADVRVTRPGNPYGQRADVPIDIDIPVHYGPTV